MTVGLRWPRNSDCPSFPRLTPANWTHRVSAAGWDQGSNTISSRLKVPVDAVRRTLLKKRLTEAAPSRPEQRWAVLAGQLDQRLLRQGDWPPLAQL